MPVDHNHIPKPELLRKLPGLKDVSDMLSPYLPDLDIGFLIGVNCSAALQPLEVVPTQGNGPFAVRYKHGWTINGPLQIKCNVEDRAVVCNKIVLKESVKITECFSPDSVLRLFELDFHEQDLGKTPGERGYSVEDRRFIQEMEENLRFVDGHFEIPLPFRSDNLMPCNKEQAVKRILGQKKKMLKNDTYHKDYVAFTNTILAKGYATGVPEDELPGRPGYMWYLPHHGVYHPKKPNKIRVVFDCSAKFDGLSINDVLLQGPDLANSLIGVLTRFRSDQFAFMVDVASMFHQVKVPQKHRDYLRFLWWPDDVHSELKEYRMTVHTFGTVSSPTIANYALRSTASKAKGKYDDNVTQTLERNFYVDDCLKSVENDEIAIDLIGNLRHACADGGFNLTKFTSNSKTVLSTILNEHRSKEIQTVDLNYDVIPMKRALGMQWDIALNSFKYMVDLPEKPFYPLYLHYMIPLGLYPLFCYQQRKYFRVVSQQLHIFSDASTTGYGCSAYIRLFDVNGIVHTSLLLGKARLAPLKHQTIPRLELTAATASVKIGQFLLQELDLDIDSVTYYTDSTTVLHYISNEKSRFPIFVTNRVKLIRDYLS